MDALAKTSQLLLAEAKLPPPTALESQLLIIDAPDLADELFTQGYALSLYCDDIRQTVAKPYQIVDNLDEWLKAVDNSITQENPNQNEFPIANPSQTKNFDPDTTLETITNPATILVLMLLPKSLSQLAEYAQILARYPVQIISAQTTKYLSHSMNTVLSKYFTEVWASRGRFKSRAIHAQNPKPAFPKLWPKTQHLPELSLNITVHGGTFSGLKLDAGTALLLANLPSYPGETAIDLGCGSGIIATSLARQGMAVTAIDVSKAACNSAQATATANGLTQKIKVLNNDGLQGFPEKSAKLIASNPPFHVKHAKETAPTFEMFRQAQKTLQINGEIWIVYNSHLPYLQWLRQIFGNAKIVAQNPKYTVACAQRLE